MGAYLYAAMGPRHAKRVVVRKPDGIEEAMVVYALSYVYKPSWYGPLQRDLSRRYDRVVKQREEAWDAFEVPACAVIVSSLDDNLNRKRPSIEVGNQVLTWRKHAYTCPIADPYNFSQKGECTCEPQAFTRLSVMDDPDWGRATSVGTVVKVLGPAEIKTAMRCNRCHRAMKGTTAYDGACECGGLIEAGRPMELRR